MGTPLLPFGNTYILLKKLIILLKKLFILLKKLFILLKRLFILLKSLLVKFWSFATKTKTKTKKPPLIGKALSCLAGVFRFGFDLWSSLLLLGNNQASLLLLSLTRSLRPPPSPLPFGRGRGWVFGSTDSPPAHHPSHCCRCCRCRRQGTRPWCWRARPRRS